jgi:hypothetical protein
VSIAGKCGERKCGRHCCTGACGFGKHSKGSHGRKGRKVVVPAAKQASEAIKRQLRKERKKMSAAQDVVFTGPPPYVPPASVPMADSATFVERAAAVDEILKSVPCVRGLCTELCAAKVRCSLHGHAALQKLATHEPPHALHAHAPPHNEGLNIGPTDMLPPLPRAVVPLVLHAIGATTTSLRRTWLIARVYLF